MRPMGTELFHSDRRTDMTKLIVALRKFAKANKMIDVMNMKYFYFRRCFKLPMYRYRCSILY
jgi:hypothetical protein